MGVSGMDTNLAIGMTGEKRETVSNDNTAIKHGSGSLQVYATPAMVALMEGACVNCQRCNQACPMNIQVSAGKSVRNAQCINCFSCISACPSNGTLSYGPVNFPRKKETPPAPQS